MFWQDNRAAAIRVRLVRTVIPSATAMSEGRGTQVSPNISVAANVKRILRIVLVLRAKPYAETLLELLTVRFPPPAFTIVCRRISTKPYGKAPAVDQGEATNGTYRTPNRSARQYALRRRISSTSVRATI